MRKLRWGRIGGALLIAGLAVPAAHLGWLRLTAPEAPAAERVTAGTLDCATGEVLDGLVEAHQAGAAEETLARLARRAAACERVTPVTVRHLDLIQAVDAVVQGAARAGEAGRHDEALSIALDVWTAGVEQGRTEPFVGAMVALAAGTIARPVVADALSHASLPAALTAAARLDGLAAVDLPLGDIMARTEADAWSYGLLSPGASALQLPRILPSYRRAGGLDGIAHRAALEARADDHDDATWRWVVQGALDALELRAHASALATAARLRQALERDGRCPDHLADLGDVPDDPLTGRELAYDAGRCLVVTGALLDRQPFVAGPVPLRQ